MLGARAASRQKRNSFTSTWDTRNAGTSSGNQITLPLISAGGKNFIAHWGDGTKDNITAFDQAEVTHTYPESGIYEIRIGGGITGWRFNTAGDDDKILNISNFQPLVINDNRSFDGCSNLTVSTDDGPTLEDSAGQDCDRMFDDNNLGIGGFRYWDLGSTCDDFGQMFNGNTNFDADLSLWDTSNAILMDSMFNDTNFNNLGQTGIGNWNTSNVTTMSNMFNSTPFNQDIGSWDVGNVVNMQQMFDDAAEFNNGGSSSISGWNTSNVTAMRQMFIRYRDFNQPIGTWDVSNVTTFFRMFERSQSNDQFNQDLGNWNINTGVGVNVSMEEMFADMDNFNNGGSPSISGWNTSRVNNMSSMFSFCDVFNQPIGTWDLSNVTSINGMFNGATNFNQPLSGWGSTLTGVTSLQSLFDRSAFDQDIGNWDVSRVEDISFMFDNNNVFNNGGSNSITGWDVSKVTDMSFMFNNGGNSVFNQPIGLWTTSSLQNIQRMFDVNGTHTFDQDLSNWIVTGITNATDFMARFDGLSTTNYDLLLSGWAQQSGDLQSGVSIHFGGSQYSIATGEQYRNILTGAGWSIQDGGSV